MKYVALRCGLNPTQADHIGAGFLLDCLCVSYGLNPGVGGDIMPVDVGFLEPENRPSPHTIHLLPRH